LRPRLRRIVARARRSGANLSLGPRGLGISNPQRASGLERPKSRAVRVRPRAARADWCAEPRGEPR
jgi:hypothetical protein